jgi:hypothetical protein
MRVNDLQCPKKAAQSRPLVEVRCAICGDTSHPTRDCRQQQQGLAHDPSKAAALDSVSAGAVARRAGGACCRRLCLHKHH